MFSKLFGRKQEKNLDQFKSNAEASKGYHTCVDTCERDISNLETEIECLKKDNTTLIGELAALKVSKKDHETDVTTLEDKLALSQSELSGAQERISELEKRLEEADQRADGTPVKYASARKTLTKAKLKQLRDRLEAVPANANGFGGSVSVYDKKTKRVSVVEFKSKEDALAILDKAEKGNVDIIM